MMDAVHNGGRGGTRSRRTAWTRAGLAVTGLGTIAAVALLAPGGGAVAGAAEQHGGAGHGDRFARQLERDTEAVVAAGATGVTAESVDAAGTHRTARAGVDDLERRGEVPGNAYYRIGSDTKTFVSVVTLQLVQEGKLALEDTVEELLPGVVTGNGNDGGRITVTNLLRHTSGLANYTDILFLSDPDALTPENYRETRFATSTAEEKVALALTEAPGWLPDADDPQGETRWSYSNTNYILAGMIIEKVTGHSWEHEVHERIIEPLRLRHTLTPGSGAYVPQPTATAYMQFPGTEELTDTSVLADAGADGAIISTTADMNTFLRALLGGELLEPATLETMKETVPAEEFAPGAGYGLGIVWRPVAGADPGRCADGGLWFHGGTSFGTVSEGGVSGDGRYSAAAAGFTLWLDDQEKAEAQFRAGYDLVDRAVCG
ncbi:beta-lactamase family protein [Streptomyces sp. XM4011]|nr:serine hydrolase domain-containing protein [Streptomyces sp. XM4011]MCK1815140.1 beta-lactamase family protein [Streptomyces sp. XM4011]